MVEIRWQFAYLVSFIQSQKDFKQIDYLHMTQPRKRYSGKILDLLLVNHLEFFFEDTEMQKLLSWQVNEFFEVMLSVSNNRERLSKVFFDKVDKELVGTDIDIRPVAAILVAGIYYLILHSKTMKNPFCELDINDAIDFNRVKKAISMILKQVYNPS